MKVIENYRPDEIEFTVETSQFPKTLGSFESDEDARVFMAEHLLAVQSKLTTDRFMDNVEIEKLRDLYSIELEEELPKIEEEHRKRAEELERAKQHEKEAKEMVSASINKVKQLAKEVNDRTTEITLDPANTWEVVADGKRLFYTFIDGYIKLADIRDIAHYEMEDLITSSDKNAAFFEKRKKASNE